MSTGDIHITLETGITFGISDGRLVFQSPGDYGVKIDVGPATRGNYSRFMRHLDQLEMHMEKD